MNSGCPVLFTSVTSLQVLKSGQSKLERITRGLTAFISTTCPSVVALMEPWFYITYFLPLSWLLCIFSYFLYIFHYTWNCNSIPDVCLVQPSLILYISLLETWWSQLHISVWAILHLFSNNVSSPHRNRECDQCLCGVWHPVPGLHQQHGSDRSQHLRRPLYQVKLQKQDSVPSLTSDQLCSTSGPAQLSSRVYRNDLALPTRSTPFTINWFIPVKSTIADKQKVGEVM